MQRIVKTCRRWRFWSGGRAIGVSAPATSRTRCWVWVWKGSKGKIGRGQGSSRSGFVAAVWEQEGRMHVFWKVFAIRNRVALQYSQGRLPLCGGIGEGIGGSGGIINCLYKRSFSSLCPFPASSGRNCSQGIYIWKVVVLVLQWRERGRSFFLPTCRHRCKPVTVGGGEAEG